MTIYGLNQPECLYSDTTVQTNNNKLEVFSEDIPCTILWDNCYWYHVWSHISCLVQVCGVRLGKVVHVMSGAFGLYGKGA